MSSRHIAEYEETLKSLHARLDVLEKDDVPHRHTASSSIDPPNRELEEQMDHLVALVGNLNSFRQSVTISQQIATLQADLRQLQQQPTGTYNNLTSKQYKMPKFSIDRFDDYHKADPIRWWQGFTNELSIHLVPPESKISALYLCSTGASQVWLNHLAQTEGVDVAKLYTKITWEAMTEKWRKCFIVNDAKAKGVNRIFSMHQDSQPTCEWLTEWQKLVTIPNLDIPFVHLRREFFQRSVDTLSTALGERSLHTDFDQIVDKARVVIQTNRWAANERRSQPNFVEKGKGPRPQQVAAVQCNGQEDDQALTHESSEGDGVNALPRRNNKKKKAKSVSATEVGQSNKPWTKFSLMEEQYKLRQRQTRRPSTAKLRRLSFAGSEATPLPTPLDTVALLTTSSMSGEYAYVANLHEGYKDYAVQLVLPLDQPLHVQESYACAASAPSPSEPESSPTLLGNSSVWSRLEDLDPLTPEDFHWMPLPPFGSLPKPHCNALMAELGNYLHVAVPAPLMEDGVGIVDLREYIAKIDSEYATQRYDNVHAPLLYVRIQIGKATCNALIDCGATRNYISQDFMMRAGLGPRVQRKSQPTQVALADGRTHKTIDRCVESVPVYFAPHAREAVSFDILDTVRHDFGHVFEWVVMPFGLTDAPTTFQAAMTTEFRDMLDRFVLIYLDDILVYNRNLDEHIAHLCAVLDRLRTTKYNANRAKCEFVQQELDFVTPEGIGLLANKIKAIQDWPEPTNTTEVRSFMGLAGYYQRFIGGYARIASPLSILQSPKVPFQFTDEVRSSFHKLKMALLLALVLSIYDPTLPTRVTTDASGYGMGAVLEQHDEVDWHPVEYFSQKGMKEPICRFYIACIVLALEYLHARNIVYRDLKPENIMVGADGYIKLADFGFGKVLTGDGRTYTFCGTPGYVAPESVLARGYGTCIDWWGLGVVTYVLLSGRQPFGEPTEDPMVVMSRIVDQTFEAAAHLHIANVPANLWRSEPHHKYRSSQ
ncbi:hypothetical protein CBR_g9065 [Chara braunii]|uniref:Protein kinase domain-containing protein n=1 Tax=Chara braunii TaxID=69332 RepID=A0A388KNL8_CHABU|nr:hypothetical protein CBR_g9065 [Chara braunii]|eukprot:GBG71649.1 hypothetical protein CBR_g9065 [Chara braunii]